MSTKRYTREFKMEAVKLVVEQGMTRSEVAHYLKVNYTTIREWLQQYGPPSDDAHAPDDVAAPPVRQEDVRRLERRLREVTMERDILKKAIGIFSQVPK